MWVDERSFFMAKKFLVTENWKLVGRMLRIDLNGSEYAYNVSKATSVTLGMDEVNGASIYMVFKEVNGDYQFKGFFELEKAEYHLLQQMEQTKEFYEITGIEEQTEKKEELLQFLFEEFLKNRS